MIKAALFDLDGTLVNSLEDLATSGNFALESFGFAIHETEKYKYFVGNGMPKLIERILPLNSDGDTKKKVLEVFMNHYRQHYIDKTKPYDEIIPLLNELKNRGIKIGVVSNKAHEMTLNVVDKIFGNVFDFVTGKVEGKPTKPDPELTLSVMEELGVKPSECVFIGDSGMDAAVAKNADCIGIGVLWGFRKKDELLENGAHYTVKSPKEILNIIEELNK